jgi:glycine cleavage system H protein
MPVPPDLHYTAEHEWVRSDGDRTTVGITAFAAEALGEIVFVSAPGAGTRVRAGEACGEIESTKSVSDLIAPVSGVVVEVNERLADHPEVINAAPYSDGWIMRLAAVESVVDLLDAAAYDEIVSGGVG